MKMSRLLVVVGIEGLVGCSNPPVTPRAPGEPTTVPARETAPQSDAVENDLAYWTRELAWAKEEFGDVLATYSFDDMEPRLRAWSLPGEPVWLSGGGYVCQPMYWSPAEREDESTVLRGKVLVAERTNDDGTVTRRYERIEIAPELKFSASFTIEVAHDGQVVDERGEGGLGGSTRSLGVLDQIDDDVARFNAHYVRLIPACAEQIRFVPCERGTLACTGCWGLTVSQSLHGEGAATTCEGEHDECPPSDPPDPRRARLAAVLTHFPARVVDTGGDGADEQRHRGRLPALYRKRDDCHAEARSLGLTPTHVE